MSSFNSILLWSLVLIAMASEVICEDICLRFPQMKACALLRGDTTMAPPPETADDMYCSIECNLPGVPSEGIACSCLETPSTSTTVLMTTLPNTTLPLTTTTVPPTTNTPEPPGYCVYSLEREPRLETISKRLYDPDPVATNCEYPGIIGIFDENKKAHCTVILVDEETVVMDTFCMGTVSSGHYQILAKSYYTSDISDIQIDAGTLKFLDSTSPQKTELYTAKLRSPLEFDRECIQPACIPNKDIEAVDINFEDCRFVGYGNTADMDLNANILPEQVEQLMEVKVKVDESSIKDTLLKTIRNKAGAEDTGPCFYDNAAPLICSHKTTLEWVVVGVTSLIGYPCSNPGKTKVTVQSFLFEAESPDYYNSLQSFKYSSRGKIQI